MISGNLPSATFIPLCGLCWSTFFCVSVYSNVAPIFLALAVMGLGLVLERPYLGRVSFQFSLPQGHTCEEHRIKNLKLLFEKTRN